MKLITGGLISTLTFDVKEKISTYHKTTHICGVTEIYD